MKNYAKKVLSVFLAVLLVFSAFSVAASAATPETVLDFSQTDENGKAGYLAIGDSIGRGCGAYGFYYLEKDRFADGQYDNWYCRNVVGSYPLVLADYIHCSGPYDMTAKVGENGEDISYWPCCFPGMTTAVALDLYGVTETCGDTGLKYEYYNRVLQMFGYEGSTVGAKGDSVENIHFNDDVTKTPDDKAYGRCGNIIELTQNARLITVELGMCDIFYRTYQILKKNSGLLKDGFSLDASLLKDIPGLLETVVTLLKEGYAMWEAKYPVLIEEIQKLNPNATIVMVGSFNLVNQLTLLDNTKFPLGSLFSKITNDMNKCYEKWARRYGVLYADVSNTETKATENDYSVLPDFMDDSFGGSHPSQNGHNYMARQILDLLPVKDDTKNIKVDLGRFTAEDVESVSVNGIILGKNSYSIDGYVLTIPYSGPLAITLTIGVRVDGKLGFQTYKLKYSKDGYTAHRQYGNNDIGGFLARPFKLIGQIFEKLFDLIKGIFKK